jgi:Mrp family chromosome partitioning ATPase/uncharacterized protein involved in exopolysaccharide biosynthesis
MYDPQAAQFEPTVAGAAWQYRWLVLFLAVGFAGLAWLYASGNDQWVATASLAVEDPRTSNLFGSVSGIAPERYVQRQAAIMQSRSVAHRAVELAAEADPPVAVTVDAIVDQGLSVTAADNSGLITLSYTAVEPDEAVVIVNAIGDAYQEVSRNAAAATFAAALDELDSSIVELTGEIASLQEQVQAFRSGDADRTALQAQYDDAISRLLLYSPPGATATAEEITAASGRLGEIQLEISTLATALTQADADPELQSLIDEQTQARQRLSDLQTVRDQRAVDAQLVSSGVVFYDPAETAGESSIALLVIAGFVLGGAIGSAIALPLAKRRRRFTSRSEPERLLGVRLLADVPSFFEERLKTLLPVVDAPVSVSAESFRFVSAAIALQQDRSIGDVRSAAFRSIIVTSSGIAEGKTVACANIGFAVAFEGSRVLVIDADFGNQALTRLLLGEDAYPTGLTDVIRGTVPLSNAIQTIDRGAAGSLDLLARGHYDMSAPDFVSAPETSRLLAHLAEIYDLILIDGPPLLRVAYSTTLARLADRALVIVGHGHDMRGADELRTRLDLVGTPLLGYVYNQAPLRAEMAATMGSMLDPLGIAREYRREEPSEVEPEAGAAPPPAEGEIEGDAAAPTEPAPGGERGT